VRTKLPINSYLCSFWSCASHCIACGSTFRFVIRLQTLYTVFLFRVANLYKSRGCGATEAHEQAAKTTDADEADLRARVPRCTNRRLTRSHSRVNASREVHVKWLCFFHFLYEMLYSARSFGNDAISDFHDAPYFMTRALGFLLFCMNLYQDSGSDQ